MSIINEALKKASRKRTSPTIKIAPAPLDNVYRNTVNILERDLENKAWQRKKWIFFGGISGGLVTSLLLIAVFLGRDFFPMGDLNLQKETLSPLPLSAKEITNVNQTLPPAEPIKLNQIKPKRFVRLPNLKLDGIIEGRGESMAVVNGKVVNRGDVISGATVAKINKDNILMVYGDQEFVLRIK